MEPTRSDVRRAIIDAMRGEGPRDGPPGQYKRLTAAVAHLLDDRGFEEGVEAGDPFSGGRLEGVAERRLREQVWELISTGILVVGKDRMNDEWPFLSLTEPGERLIEHDRPTPADPHGYVASVDELIPGEEQRVLLYLREAVGAFNRQLYVAATVMLGVAAEGLVLRLAEAAIQTFDDPTAGEDWYEREIEDQFALPQFRVVRDRIEELGNDMPYQLRERFEGHWHSIHMLLRMERNETGHPSGVERSREEVQSSLLLFPTLARLVRDFEAWVE